ncbi:hypothetical protein GY45DRAFT_789052 [Cubamyces sp. BRFM 1775]|nr:hypothetical protein GY45DRAFT_789052 [Cubamyces sp. BRFM 1775]
MRAFNIRRARNVEKAPVGKCGDERSARDERRPVARAMFGSSPGRISKTEPLQLWSSASKFRRQTVSRVAQVCEHVVATDQLQLRHVRHYPASLTPLPRLFPYHILAPCRHRPAKRLRRVRLHLRRTGGTIKSIGTAWLSLRCTRRIATLITRTPSWVQCMVRLTSVLPIPASWMPSCYSAITTPPASLSIPNISSKGIAIRSYTRLSRHRKQL